MATKVRKKVDDKMRAAIAAKKFEGKTHREIAAETGLNLSTVQRQLHDARTGSIVLDFKLNNREQLNQMLREAISTIRKRIKSNDENVSLRAAVAAFRVAVAGDVAIRPDPAFAEESRRRGDFTLEEMVAAYIEATSLKTSSAISK